MPSLVSKLMFLVLQRCYDAQAVDSAQSDYNAKSDAVSAQQVNVNSASNAVSAQQAVDQPV